MADEGQASGTGGSAFAIAGRVTRWEPMTGELAIGGRVLRVAAALFFVGNIADGASIMVSGHYPSDPGAQWVVTHLRVA